MWLLDCLCRTRRGCFVSVESIVHWLHYPGTVSLLVICFLITVTTCSLGEPVACASVDGDCPPSENKQCWNQFLASSTDDAFDGQVKAQRIHPYTSIQWIFLVQIVLISLPLFANYVVNTCDRTAQAVIERLQIAACQLDENDRDNDVNSAVNSFLDDEKTSEGIAWLLSFCARNTRVAIACLKIILEVFMFASVLGSFCMIAGFFGYSVPQFQAMVDAYVSNGFRNNETGYPMYEAFPRMRDCVLDMQGPDGTTTKLTRNCLLSQNMVLENLIVFLWLWYMALMVVTAVFLAYRLYQSLDSKHHCSTLKPCLKRTDKTKLLQEDLTAIAEQCGFGQVLLLYNVGRRVDVDVFNDFLHGVGVALTKWPQERSGGDEEEGQGLTCTL